MIRFLVFTFRLDILSFLLKTRIHWSVTSRAYNAKARSGNVQSQFNNMLFVPFNICSILLLVLFMVLTAITRQPNPLSNNPIPLLKP
jgi:hypothetical protein